MFHCASHHNCKVGVGLVDHHHQLHWVWDEQSHSVVEHSAPLTSGHVPAGA